MGAAAAPIAPPPRRKRIALPVSDPLSTKNNSPARTSNPTSSQIDGPTGRLRYAGTASRVANEDFTPPDSVTLPAGDPSVSVTITIRDDREAEGDETIVVTATLDGTPAGTATLTIEDTGSSLRRTAAIRGPRSRPTPGATRRPTGIAA